MKRFAPLIFCISTKEKLLAALTSSKPRTKDFTYGALSAPRVAPVGGGGFRVFRLKYDALIFSYSLRARWLARTPRDTETASTYGGDPRCRQRAISEVFGPSLTTGQSRQKLFFRRNTKYKRREPFQLFVKVVFVQYFRSEKKQMQFIKYGCKK